MATFPVFQTTTTTAAQTRFGLQLLQQVAQAAGEGTVAVSPLGVLAGLALVLAGAGGTTRAALKQVLFGAAPDLATAEKTFANWLQQLLQPSHLTDNEGNKVLDGAVLLLATSIWADQRFTLAPDFVAQAQALYQAEAATLDFNAPSAAATINEWVRQHTQGKIDSIVSARTLAGTPPPELILLNAVYFRARWALEFDAKATKPGLFRRANGTTQEVSLMHQTNAGIGYLAGTGWQAVAIPYRSYGRSFSMLVFLPDELGGLPAFVAGLDATTWATWHQELQTPQDVIVDLTLPRFTLEWSDDLAPVLRQLGLAPVFTPGADLSAVGFRPENGGGYIEAALHKTFLQVDEEGTEAASIFATIGIGGGNFYQPRPRRVVVKVDSPFLYAIVDNEDGTLLFAGAVNELSNPLS